MSADQPSSKVTHLPDEHDRQLSALYGQTDAQPPAETIDRRILEAAREAAAQAAMKSKPTLTRRRVPLSVAATILVMVGLVPLLMWNLHQRNAEVVELAAPTPQEAPAEAEPKAGPEDAMPAVRQKAQEAQGRLQPSAPQAAAPVEGGEAASAGTAPAAPEQARLEEIHTLIAAGQDAEAWQRFGDFRREYPEYRIPDALLDELAGVRARLLEQATGQ